MKTDLEIQRNVMDQLRWQPILDAAEIGVSVKNGIVTLSGLVNSYPKKLAAEKAAKKVSGVKAVAEDIVVRIYPEKQKTDTELAEAVANALKWNSAVVSEKIKIKVEDGFVTLSGEVDWSYERSMAINAIENLSGVRLVVNNISLKPKPMAGDISRKIESAFQRHASIDSGKVKVSVTGNKVTLTGIVRSWNEKDDAEEAAWAATGVSQVINNLTVEEEEFAF
ncbi:BON domain-containing protein [Dyadobacter luticola]|uniref:BON domain-containing protein n=1 Tax=Dyadobacter luticola TaxID=1979387 RepID=A0A5R9L2E7_9BACT|nr:BON domain-containing protein [Dyadobacter luticola]TLV02430.1 BON domain-containing protein [Dyadobacter luticola]